MCENLQRCGVCCRHLCVDEALTLAIRTLQLVEISGIMSAWLALEVVVDTSITGEPIFFVLCSVELMEL